MEENDNDRYLFLGNRADVRNDGIRTTREIMHPKEYVAGGVGTLASGRKRRFALVHDGGRGKKWDGGIFRRCEIGAVGSEESESLTILLGRRGGRKRCDAEGYSGNFRFACPKVVDASYQRLLANEASV